MLLCAESGLQSVFSFELIAIVVSVRPVFEGAQSVCTVTVVIIDILSPRAMGRFRLSSGVSIRMKVIIHQHIGMNSDPERSVASDSSSMKRKRSVSWR